MNPTKDGKDNKKEEKPAPKAKEIAKETKPEELKKKIDIWKGKMEDDFKKK